MPGRSNIRAKRAPSNISNAAQALDALGYARAYRNLAEVAHLNCLQYRPGSRSLEDHKARMASYSEVAREWEDVLRRWLETQCPVGRG